MKPLEFELKKLVYIGSSTNQYQVVEEEAPDVVSSLVCGVCPTCGTPFSNELQLDTEEVFWKCSECNITVLVVTEEL